jgi:hypothetical protein
LLKTSEHEIAAGEIGLNGLFRRLRHCRLLWEGAIGFCHVVLHQLRGNTLQ